jgi:hypothetical protein
MVHEYVLDAALQKWWIGEPQVDNETGITKWSNERRRSRNLHAEVASIIQKNEDALTKAYPGQRQIGSASNSLRCRNELIRQVETTVDFDRVYWQSINSTEMVYAVAKDEINKRITLVFRGTENELALRTRWYTTFVY